MKSSKISLLPGMLLLTVVLIGCTSNKIQPTLTVAAPTATLTQTATATLTFTPTFTFTPTPSPTPTITVTPSPTIDPLTELMGDMDLLASYYPESVVMAVAEENLPYLYSYPGFSVMVPPHALVNDKMDYENGRTNLEGNFLDSNQYFRVGTSIWEVNTLPAASEMLEIMTAKNEENPPPNAKLVSVEHEYLPLGKGEAVIIQTVFQSPDTIYVLVTLSVVESYSANLDLSLIYTYQNEYAHGEDLTAETSRMKEAVLSLHDGFQIGSQADEPWLSLLPAQFFSGLCPTETDPGYGYSEDNPIKIVDQFTDTFEASMTGPALAANYLHTLLYDGQPVTFLRLNSLPYNDTILDRYQITGPAIKTPIYLYVDQYSGEPYRVPAGFGCVGFLYPDHILNYSPLD